MGDIKKTGMDSGHGASKRKNIGHDRGIEFHILNRIVGHQNDLVEQVVKNGVDMVYNPFFSDTDKRLIRSGKALVFSSGQDDAGAAGCHGR